MKVDLSLVQQFWYTAEGTAQFFIEAKMENPSQLKTKTLEICQINTGHVFSLLFTTFPFESVVHGTNMHIDKCHWQNYSVNNMWGQSQ